MSQKTIAFDIDDVLSTNVHDFVAYCNERWGTNLKVDDYSEDWIQMWGLDREAGLERSRLYHESGVVGRYGHHDEAIPILQELKKRFKLVIVTSRRKVLMPETSEWIANYFEGLFEEIHYAGIWDDESAYALHGTKAEICEQIGADYLVDDQPKHCIAAANAGIESVLFGEYGWNQVADLPKGVTRVKTWQEVGAYFDKRSR